MVSIQSTSQAVGGQAPVEGRFPAMLRRAWYSMNRTFRRRIQRFDLTPDQFTVLRWLHDDDSEGLTQRDLAERMASDANTITSILCRMEKSGLVERRPHESDRRAKRIAITPAGLARYEEARPAAAQLQYHVLSALNESEQQQFLHYLERIAEAARATHHERD